MAGSDEFRQYLGDLLVEMCAVDTTPRADVEAFRDAEARVFEIVEREARACSLDGLRAERVPVRSDIADHPFFSPPYYTRSPERPAGLDPAACYAGRHNLIICVDGDGHASGGVNQALNAHIDVVAPYFPPRREGNVVHGRGACDDKGSVVATIGALKLLGAHLSANGRRLNRHLTAMIVIDEEMGGNGSLSCATDRRLRERYDSLVVMECADGGLFPGNRGCVWYKIEGELAGAHLFEAALFIVEALEAEGRTLRAESDHPLFPHRPVQTCHGIIGNCGEHPSRINGDVSFEVLFAGQARPQEAAGWVRDLIDAGLAEYVAAYGDRTKELDPRTQRPKVDHHYDWSEVPGGFRVRVWGSTGHMGSIFENDGAITKMAAMARGLVRNRRALEALAGGRMRLRLADWPDEARLLMEGGQGFVPTHDMADVQRRMRAAAIRGCSRYMELAGVTADPANVIRVTFEKLHNAAFAGRADSPDMRHAIDASKAAGLWKGGPIRGWDVSCDARIFACEYPDLPVITTGPGLLAHAHSDHEQIDLKDVARASEFLARFILKQTATA